MKLDGLGVFLEVERMVPSDMPGEAVQQEPLRSVTGNEAEQTGQTCDALVRAVLPLPALTLTEVREG